MGRTGRPPKGGEEQGAARLTSVRLTKDVFDKLDYCAELLDTTRTSIIEFGINLAHERISKKKE